MFLASNIDTIFLGSFVAHSALQKKSTMMKYWVGRKSVLTLTIHKMKKNNGKNSLLG